MGATPAGWAMLISAPLETLAKAVMATSSADPPPPVLRLNANVLLLAALRPARVKTELVLPAGWRNWPPKATVPPLLAVTTEAAGRNVALPALSVPALTIVGPV